MQALNCTFYSWQKGLANCTESVFGFWPKLFYGPEINLWSWATCAYATVSVKEVCLSVLKAPPAIHPPACWSTCIIDAFLVSVFFKGVDDNVSSNVLRGQFFSCYSVGEGCFLICLEAHQLNVFKRTPSNISSNGRLLQMFFFFKCILLQTFFFFAFFFKRSSSLNAPFFRCSSTSNAPFFKCVPSSNALRLGQLNHWGWQCKLHYHGPRNSGRRWLHPLDLKTRESEPGPEYLKWYSYGNSENNSSLKLPPLMWVGNVTSWWNLVLARYLLISFSSFFAQ